MTLVSHEGDITVAKKVAVRLIERLRKDDLINKDRWRKSQGEQAFITLLEMLPDLSGEERI
jgi:hypothetical protein